MRKFPSDGFGRTMATLAKVFSFKFTSSTTKQALVSVQLPEVTITAYVPFAVAIYEGLVYDAVGKCILTESREGLETLNYQLNVASGTYYLHLQLANTSGVFKLVVK